MHRTVFFLLLFLAADLSAQTTGSAVVTGIVIDDTRKAVEYANVTLHASKDSTLVKGALSDQDGRFKLEKILPGQYLIRVSFVGFQPYSTVVSIGQQTPVAVPEIVLRPSVTTLKDVTVEAKKPFIEKQLDRLVVNVDNSIIGAGSSAMEILERAPSLVIDQNDNITMKGKSGVIVMIDGKITPISGQDLANMLRGMSSGAIEKIELITNPSARFDAAGSAGIINIKLKKDQRLGLNGSVTLGAGYGMYGRDNEGFSFNFRNKKMNVFGNYNLTHRKQYVNLSLERRFFDAATDTLTGGFDQTTLATQDITNHTYRLGTDFFPGKNTIIGYTFSGTSNSQYRDYASDAKALNYREQTDSLFTTLNTSNEILNNYAVNLNLKHSFDSSRRDLTLDLDFANFKTDMDPRLDITYYGLEGQTKGTPYSLLGISDGTLNIYSVKSDYTHQINKQTRLEAGMKSSYVKADNDLVFHIVTNGVSKYDSSRSNHFIYEEQINAGYVNFSKVWPRINVLAGLRAEQTNVKGNQVTTNQIFDTTYLRFFPSASMNFNLKKKDVIGVSVSRRIGRPSYSMLNPFKYFIDPTSYRTGNPGLLPQFTYSYELSYTKQGTNATLSYSVTRKTLSGVLQPERDGENIYSVETTQNLTLTRNFGLSITSEVELAKWWTSVNNLDLYYNTFEGNIANSPLKNSSPAMTFVSNNNLSFGKGWSGEFTFYYRANQTIGYATFGGVYRFAAGLQKTVLNKMGSVRVSVTDIFWSDIARNASTFNIYRQDYRVKRNTRVASITFVYRFGKTTVARERRRNGGAEEEKGRAN